jgi:hypothetical protein
MESKRKDKNLFLEAQNMKKNSFVIFSSPEFLFLPQVLRDLGLFLRYVFSSVSGMKHQETRRCDAHGEIKNEKKNSKFETESFERITPRK